MAGRIDLVEEERRRNAQAVAPQATSGASVPAQVPVSQPVAQPQPQVQSPAPVPGTVGTAIPDVGTVPLQAPSLTQAPVKPEATPLSMYDKFADMTAEQAINTGEITPQGYWNIQSEAIKAGKRDPYSTEEIIEMMRTSDPEYETGEQRARRERNDRASRAITGISDLISNIAGMVGTAKGSSPVVVNNLAPLDARQREITERRNALKRKYDTLLTNAKMGEIAYQRDLEAARQKAQRDYRLKLALKDIDARIRKGEIDQKQANAMTLEAYRQANRMATEQFKAENRSKEEAANRANQIKVANIRSGGSGESGKRGIITIPTANGYVDVKEKSFNDPTVTSILYNQLDTEYKIPEVDLMGNRYIPTRDEMKQAIGRWVADGHELNIPQSIIESEDSFNIDDYEVKESDFEDNKVGKRKK